MTSYDEDEVFGGASTTPGRHVDRPLHPKGPCAIRLADIFDADPGYGKSGSPYPRTTLVWLSAKKDEDGNPLWLFTKCSKNTYGGIKNGQPLGKPTRLHGIVSALIGHTLEEHETVRRSELVGKYAMGNITHITLRAANGRNWAQVETVMPLPEGMEVEIDLSGYRRPGFAGNGEAQS